MLTKSKLLALTLVLSVLLPIAALADEGSSGCKKVDPILGWTIGLPFKAVGAALSSATGVLVGTTTGLVRGAVKGTKESKVNHLALSNISKGFVIEDKVRIAKSFFSQLRGLMFVGKKSFDYALVFPLPAKSVIGASIHCLFVFFPIDVIYLDENKKVVDVKRNVPPFALYRQPARPAKYFIEVNSGKAGRTTAGDRLEWQ